jgi:sulfate permease, SulP family
MTPRFSDRWGRVMIKPTGFLSPTVDIPTRSYPLCRSETLMSRGESPRIANARTAQPKPWWRSYRRQWLGRDLLAGVAVAAYMVPQVMGYAAIAGLPPIAGLWASLLPLVVYALIGSSPQLSLGPESTTALLTATTLAAMSNGDPDQLASVAGALAIATGLVCVVGRLLRAGYLSALLSRPILVGYLLGVAVLMVISQLGHLTGLSVPSGSVLTQVGYVLTHLSEINVATVIMAAAILVVLFVGTKLLPRMPWTLIAMLLAAAVVVLGHLERYGVELVGSIPAGWPRLTLPEVSWAEAASLLPAALGLSVVAYSDTVLTGRGFGTKTGDQINPNRELVALGVANVAAGLSQGLPVSSSASRTAIAYSLYARTQLYSLVVAVMIALTMAFGRPILAAFPWAGLGAVIVYAATRVVDIGELRRMARFRRSELGLALATAAAVVVLGVLWGIAAAIALSLADLLRRIARPHDALLGYLPGQAGMHNVRDRLDGRQVPGLVIYRYDSPLFFANAVDLVERALRAVDQADPPAQWFVLDAEANINLDLTAADALEELRARLADRGIVFATTHLRTELRTTLARTGWVERVGADHLFATLPTAVAAYEHWLRDHPMADATGDHTPLVPRDQSPEE